MSNVIAHVRAAAERGDANAQFNLGVLYGNGLNDKGHIVGGNRLDAIEWLRKAANQGLLRAQSKLAELYADGESEGDLEQACAWFLVASENSDGGGRLAARDGFEKTARKLSAELVSCAQVRAKAWIARIQEDCDKRDVGINAVVALRTRPPHS